jgi:cellulose synthase/poly-beta-1,6-N-acetylglucosamine synthase-like glycosyltransferase
MLSGWVNHYSPDSFVSQQGVPKMRPLIRQRTRWFQGHITCWHHIPALMGKKSPVIARTDTIYYLLAPVLIFMFLPSSLIFLAWSIYFLVSGASSVVLSPLNYLPVFIAWYLFSFGALPTVVWTFWREEKEISAWKAFLWAHIFSFFYVIWFVAGCQAIYRIVRGQGGWAKTARTEELRRI